MDMDRFLFLVVNGIFISNDSYGFIVMTQDKGREIIPVDKDHRVLVYKEFRGNEWKWYVEKQINLFWNFWVASDWNSSNRFVIIDYCTTKDSAIAEAKSIRRKFLSE